MYLIFGKGYFGIDSWRTSNGLNKGFVNLHQEDPGEYIQQFLAISVKFYKHKGLEGKKD